MILFFNIATVLAMFYILKRINEAYKNYDKTKMKKILFTFLIIFTLVHETAFSNDDRWVLAAINTKGTCCLVDKLTVKNSYYYTEYWVQTLYAEDDKPTINGVVVSRYLSRETVDFKNNTTKTLQWIAYNEAGDLIDSKIIKYSEWYGVAPGSVGEVIIKKVAELKPTSIR